MSAATKQSPLLRADALPIAHPEAKLWNYIDHLRSIPAEWEILDVYAEGPERQCMHRGCEIVAEVCEHWDGLTVDYCFEHGREHGFGGGEQ